MWYRSCRVCSRCGVAFGILLVSYLLRLADSGVRLRRRGCVLAHVPHTCCDWLAQVSASADGASAAGAGTQPHPHHQHQPVPPAVSAAEYLRDRVGVPRDMQLPAARQLRAHINFFIDTITQ